MKKIIDKNGRLFGVISIIDVAVLLVVAVMALALYVRGTGASPAPPCPTS